MHTSLKNTLKLLSALALSGCFRTQVWAGPPPSSAQAPHEAAWQHSLFLGAVTIGGPVDLERECPDGWAEISTSSNLLQGLLTLITYGIYSPRTFTVVCAAPPGATPAPQASTYPPPLGATPYQPTRSLPPERRPAPVPAAAVPPRL